jgi:hypothetical protein
MYKSLNSNCRFWRQTERNHRHWFWGQIGRNRCHQFWGQTETNHCHQFWGQTERNRPSGFEVKPLINRRTLFWGSTKKPALIVFMCKVQTAHGVTDLLIVRPLNTRFVRPSRVLYTRSPIPATILVAAHHAALAICTLQDKQTQFFTRYKDKGKTTEMSLIHIQTKAYQWLITIKLSNWPLGFLISPLMTSLITKSTKFEVQI